MSWLAQHPKLWRIAVLLLLLAALLGPWAYDVINVPAEFACEAPFVRLDGDFCGAPLPGIGLISFIVGGIVQLLEALFSGSVLLLDRGREMLLLLMALLMFLPLMSALLFFKQSLSRAQNISLLVVWSLAAICSSIYLLMISGSTPGIGLWGLWLYVATTIAALLVEGIMLPARME